MTVILTTQNLTHSFGSAPLFQDLNFSLHAGERVGLIGPNGVGKSTLLKILAGQVVPESGEINLRSGLKVSRLEQEPRFSQEITVGQFISEALQGVTEWQREAKLQEAFAKWLAVGATHFPQGLETKVASLSGGWQRRIALAKAMISEPDLLLLDEPTNHLDVESILWLEDKILKSNFATLVITHDRAFLEKISQRIIELNPAYPEGMLSVNGNYSTYLERYEQVLAEQDRHAQVLRNTLRRETEWLRRGARARSTKQQARIARAEELGEQLANMKQRQKMAAQKVDLDFSLQEKRPDDLLYADKISKAYRGVKLFEDLSLLVKKNTRMGLIGPNGCGKSTLLKVLFGEEKADQGKIRYYKELKYAYFSQHRASLDPQTSVLQTLCPSGDQVIYRGKAMAARAYLKRFLFEHSQLEMPVGKLSGGEQSRLLLAQLMLQECHLLVLDEPTNDLDLATLNILEECLKEYDGAVILVTHDRYFLDQVVESFLAFPPPESTAPKHLIEFASLEQWETWYRQQQKESKKTNSPINEAAKEKPKNKIPGRLGYLEQREYDQMEERIHEAEEKMNAIKSELENPEHASNAKKLLELNEQFEAAQDEVEKLYERWSELEEKRK
ncbi:MAG: ABC-F family ATP-binding cassette domain-containing protein [Deltaproteobacteria bacterium]|nr:ABC-F family ATP-binding cassette domain-containing protein [Deltaproteobacteria bacterium]